MVLSLNQSATPSPLTMHPNQPPSALVSNSSSLQIVVMEIQGGNAADGLRYIREFLRQTSPGIRYVPGEKQIRAISADVRINPNFDLRQATWRFFFLSFLKTKNKTQIAIAPSPRVMSAVGFGTGGI